MGATHSSNMRTTTLFVLFAIAGVAVCAPLGQTDMTEVFATFKADFNKPYTGLEAAKRFQIFSDNVNLIRDHNANKAATLGYTLGINELSDYTPAEYKNLRGFKYNATAEAEKTNPIFEADTTNLAASVDWTTKGAVTPVKNQKHCGGCWAFSATGALEGALFIKNHKLESLSEQELLDCVTTASGCQGAGNLNDALQYAQTSGDDLEKTYPFVAATPSCPKTPTCPTGCGICNKRLAAKADGVKRTNGFTDVKPNSCADLMAAVQKQPVSVAIDASVAGFMSYSGGIFSAGGGQIDHAVLVVGYGTDGANEYWKVKNSWGTTWGEKGYVRMKKSCAPTGRQLLGGHGGGGTSGTCGILTMPTFPNV